jgi:molybdopterin-guanine dinucleotide biosynthesis protein MobB
MVPVISFIGRHNSGKTTVLQKVIRILSDQGCRVGVIKHSSHDFNIDVPDTDSFRLFQAGARAISVSSAQKLAFYKHVQEDTSLDELCRLMQDDVDIIFTEGFKREDRPKIEVARQGISSDLINPHNLIALVVDFPVSEVKVQVFGFDDAESLCRFIQDNFMADN